MRRRGEVPDKPTTRRMGGPGRTRPGVATRSPPDDPLSEENVSRHNEPTASRVWPRLWPRRRPPPPPPDDSPRGRRQSSFWLLCRFLRPSWRWRTLLGLAISILAAAVAQLSPMRHMPQPTTQTSDPVVPSLLIPDMNSHAAQCFATRNVLPSLELAHQDTKAALQLPDPSKLHAVLDRLSAFARVEESGQESFDNVASFLNQTRSQQQHHGSVGGVCGRAREQHWAFSFIVWTRWTCISRRRRANPDLKILAANITRLMRDLEATSADALERLLDGKNELCGMIVSVGRFYDTREQWLPRFSDADKAQHAGAGHGLHRYEKTVGENYRDAFADVRTFCEMLDLGLQTWVQCRDVPAKQRQGSPGGTWSWDRRPSEGEKTTGYKSKEKTQGCIGHLPASGLAGDMIRLSGELEDMASEARQVENWCGLACELWILARSVIAGVGSSWWWVPTVMGRLLWP